jgi:hypothetical protein
MRYHVKAYDKRLWDRAQERALAMPVYENSHRKFKANQVGALGEVVFEAFLEHYNIPFTASYKTTEDIKVFGDTIDIKTKDRTVYPQPEYDCTVPLYNHEHQRPSRYVFVSLLRNATDTGENIERFSAAYLVGWCTLDRMEQGKIWEEDEVDPRNGTKFWTRCKNVYISDLRPMTELVLDYLARKS